MKQNTVGCYYTSLQNIINWSDKLHGSDFIDKSQLWVLFHAFCLWYDFYAFFLLFFVMNMCDLSLEKCKNHWNFSD